MILFVTFQQRTATFHSVGDIRTPLGVLTLEQIEKGEAQLFCDRLFRAFGHGGIIEANGSLEARIKFSSGKTKFADCLWSPQGRSGVLIEMKKKSYKALLFLWVRLVLKIARLILHKINILHVPGT